MSYPFASRCHNGIRQPLYFNPPSEYVPMSPRLRERERERREYARERAFERGRGLPSSPRSQYNGIRQPLPLNPPSEYISMSPRLRERERERREYARESFWAGSGVWRLTSRSILIQLQNN